MSVDLKRFKLGSRGVVKVFGEQSVLLASGGERDSRGEVNTQVTVVFGYNDTYRNHFCYLYGDPSTGICYGYKPNLKELTKEEYVEALRELGLNYAANAVLNDEHY